MRNKELQKYLEKFASKQAEMQKSVRQIQEIVMTESEPLPSLSGAISTSRKNKRNRFTNALTDISHCTCGANKVIVERSSILHLYSQNWGFYRDFETSIIHDRRCPMWYHSRRDTKYRFRSRIFGWSISGSLNLRRLTYAPFSGCKILPSLNIRPVVPWNSAVFRVVKRYVRGRSFQLEHISAFIRDLSIVFQSGHGSPWDVDEYGRGLLAVSYLP